MPDFTTVLAVMIGLGVGIDYALFIVTRYREGMHLGMRREDAAAVAIDTAGRAVLFAGITVVISLLGMLLMGVQFVNGLAIGAAITVPVTMAASVTLLPALLGFAGDKLEVTRWRGIIAAGLVALALVGVGLGIGAARGRRPRRRRRAGGRPVRRSAARRSPRRRAKPLEETSAYRWSHLIQRQPWPAPSCSASPCCSLLAVPVLSLRLGFSDEGNVPEDTDHPEGL